MKGTTLLAIVIAFIMADRLNAQSTAPVYMTRTNGAWSGCFQEVIISDRGRQRVFRREELQRTTQGGRPGTGTYGAWQEFPPYVDTRPPSITYKLADWPKPVDQRTVKRIMGSFLWEYFERINKRARVSGHFNLTADPRLNWDAFSGQTFGTNNERLPGDTR